ncbi:uncharacterized protein LOC126319857 [Schistocerca gregaria]|uniref:uncharacterized protein LOC126319857 n=1 Tax=Schistocerca gregaria TaxID=7010 RepID=UPI00211F37FB|nr:uncharacterized protein LOC126319857 [Schistocerca gregaria]
MSRAGFEYMARVFGGCARATRLRRQTARSGSGGGLKRSHDGRATIKGSGRWGVSRLYVATAEADAAPREAETVRLDHGESTDSGGLTLVDHTAALREALTRRRYKEFDDLIGELKEKGVSFDAEIYDLIIRSYVLRKAPTASMNCYYEMKEKGIHLTIDTYNEMIGNFEWIRDAEPTFRLYEEILELGLTPTIDTYNAMIRVALTTKNNSTVETIFEEMKEKNVDFGLSTYLELIKSYSKQHLSHNAFKWWQEMNERFQIHMSELELPMDIIDGLFKTYFYSGHIRGLKELIAYHDIKGVIIPEGAYMRCLEAVARQSEPDVEFAETIWNKLSSQYNPTQAGFSALLLAYSAGQGNLEKIFRALHFWIPKKNFHLHPTVLFYVSRTVKDQDAIECMCNFVDSMSAPIPVDCYNVILRALMHLGDSEAIWEKYQAVKNKSVTPNMMTWHVLLHSFASFRRQEYAQAVVEDMKQLGVELDHLCKEHVIRGEAMFGDIAKAVESLKKLALSAKPSFGLFYALVKLALEANKDDLVDMLINASRKYHSPYALISLKKSHKEANAAHASAEKMSVETANQ